MKLIIFFLIAIIGLNGYAQTTQDDVHAAISEGAGDGAPEIALGKLRLLPADEQRLMIEAIVGRVQKISNEADPVKRESLRYVMSAAAILYKVGTEKQILEAFENLGAFSHAEPDVAEVLASCQSSAGVEVIENLAKKRLPELEAAINSKTDEEKARARDILIPFYFLIIRMEAARNPEGPRAAKRLRDQVAARYSSEIGRAFVKALDDEMAKVRKRIEKEKNNSEPLKPEDDSAQEKAPEPTSKNIQTRAQSGSLKDQGVSTPSIVAAIFAFVLAAAALIWHVFKNRDSR